MREKEYDAAEWNRNGNATSASKSLINFDINSIVVMASPRYFRATCRKWITLCDREF